MMWELLLSVIYREAKINKERKKQGRKTGWKVWKTGRRRQLELPLVENSTVSIRKLLENENPDH